MTNKIKPTPSHQPVLTIPGYKLYESPKEFHFVLMETGTNEDGRMREYGVTEWVSAGLKKDGMVGVPVGFVQAVVKEFRRLGRGPAPLRLPRTRVTTELVDAIRNIGPTTWVETPVDFEPLTAVVFQEPPPTEAIGDVITRANTTIRNTRYER